MAIKNAETRLDKNPAEMREKQTKTPFDLRLHWTFLLVGVTYFASVALISLKGEFPIGDDFIYNVAVRETLAAGSLKLNWSAQACYLHILFGALICKLFGFSYSILRIDNVFWTAVGTVGMYLSVRTTGLGPQLSAIFAAIYLFNPIVYWLSFTYMTDAMSLALTNWFIYLTLLGLRQKSLANLAAGTLSLMTSLASRLFTAIFMVPCALAALLTWNFGASSWAVFALSIIGPLALVIGLPALFRITDPIMASVSLITMQMDMSSFMILSAHHPLQMGWKVLVALGQLAIYEGPFCAPILFALLYDHLKHDRKLPRIAWLTATAVITATIATLVGHNEKLMPFTSNILYPPYTCIPAVIGFPHSWYHEVWAGITAVCTILGFAYICICVEFACRTLWRIYDRLRKVIREGAKLTILQSILKRDLIAITSLAATYAFVALVIVAHDNDRYYSMVLAPALVVFAIVWRKLRIRGIAALAILVTSVGLICAYTVASVHDSMSSYRARWQAINDLLASGVSPKQLDGGWEFNMMQTPELIKTMHPIPGGWRIDENDRGTPPLNKVRWWPNVNDQYVVSQVECAGYAVLKRYSYRNWMLNSRKEMLSLKKLAADEVQSKIKK
jgi:hypothetical protein